MIRHGFIVLLLPSLLMSCATTPTEDSDFTIYGEQMEGPGLFSGDSGEVVFFEDKAAAPASVEPENATPSTRMPAQDWQEFLAFKRWLNARQQQDETFQEFQQWLRYEQYLQWQSSQ